MGPHCSRVSTIHRMTIEFNLVGGVQRAWGITFTLDGFHALLAPHFSIFNLFTCVSFDTLRIFYFISSFVNYSLEISLFRNKHIKKVHIKYFLKLTTFVFFSEGAYNVKDFPINETLEFSVIITFNYFSLLMLT
jgi:hypothetical protein